MPPEITIRRCRHARGISLLELLLTLLVLAFGIVAMVGVQRELHLQADGARQRSEATRLAQEDIEALRAATARDAVSADLDTPPTSPDAEAHETVHADLRGQRLNTVFHRSRVVEAVDSLPLKTSDVRVAWTTRDGSTAQTQLIAAVGTQPLALAGALLLGAHERSASGPGTIARQPPARSVDLGDGRRAWRPAAGQTTVVVIDARTAQVLQRCEVPVSVSMPRLTADQLTHCQSAGGLLLSGVVRFSNANPPAAAEANDTPLELAVSVSLPSAVVSASPWCVAQAQQTVTVRSARGIEHLAVALSDTPASLGLDGWTETGERFVAYHCIVPTSGEPRHWSGQSTLLPRGWTIGTTAVDRKVCRYAFDADGSGAIDRNAEHPSTYVAVDGPLSQQNFLVIRGDLACPAVADARMEAQPVADASTVATVQHQP